MELECVCLDTMLFARKLQVINIEPNSCIKVACELFEDW